MIKVKDIDGKEVRGLYRGPNGALVVNDQNLYGKYIAERNARVRDKEKISELEKELFDLKMLVQRLLTEGSK